MASAFNFTGSLTGVVALVLVGWVVRTVRTAQRQQQKRHLHKSPSRQRQERSRSPGRFSCTLSPLALRLLVEGRALLHCVLDARSPEDAAALPLPQELSTVAVAAPEAELETLLRSRAAWEERTLVPFPGPDHMLVFITKSEASGRACCGLAASLGYQRTAVLQGGAAALAAQGSRYQTDLRFVSREGVAALLGLTQLTPQARATVIDVRRSDERLLYGTIPGMVHLPLDQLPSAFQNLTPEDFQLSYRFPKPQKDELLVLSCRTNRRASWAAQLLQELGYQHVLVHRQGVYGWRFSAAVKPYRSYYPGDSPPEPEAFQVEEPNEEVVEQELRRLGLMP